MRFFLLFSLLFILSSCNLWKVEEKQESAVVNERAARYITIFPSDLEPHLKTKLENASILKRLEVRPPLTPFALEKRAEKDVKELTETLETLGYFDGKVHFEIKKEEDLYVIYFSITPGPLYTFSGFEIHYNGPLPPHMIRLDELNLSLKKGDAVNLEKAQDLGRKIAKYWRTKGYPFAKALDMKGVKNEHERTILVIFNISLGPKGTFGSTKVEGLTHLDERFVLNRLDYKEGDLYDEKRVDSSRKALLETGLFNEVTLTPKESSDEKTPLLIHLKEGPARSIGGGAKYETSYGVSGRIFWRHDNLLGKGESLETKLTLGRRKNEAKLAFSKPDFILKRQTLYSALSLTEEKNRPYHSKSAKVAGGLSYDATPFLQFSYGLDYEVSRIKRNGIRTRSNLLGVPLILDYDSTNSLLNPVEGLKCRIKTNPYRGKYIGHNGFWLNEIFASTYFHPKIQTIEEADNIFVLATWGKVGVIYGQENVQFIPPNKRFYSGGGNSVRGYGYQLLGPLDSNATPIGGLSVLEFGTEARFPLSEKVGAAAFIEAGSVGLQRIPKLNSSNLLWSGGIGIRYFTGIGPIRFDISVPFKRRRDPSSSKGKKIDAPFQFYISVGQAF